MESAKPTIMGNALHTITKRYLQPNESADQMWRRVAKALASVEAEPSKWEEPFYEVMSRHEFTPAGRTLANAGVPGRKVVANCVVLHPQDDLGSIFETLKDAAQLQKAGSGIGFPFHLLRPAGAKTSDGDSSGPVSFLQAYNKAFAVIKQQNRHGANMAIMSVEHPDILDFVACKRKETDLVCFNISVGLTDRFMQQVEADSCEPWICCFENAKTKVPIYSHPRFIGRDSRERVTNITENLSMSAADVFDYLVNCAWENGEPGVVFLDTVNKTDPLRALGERIHASNPCGEQFLHDGDNCNLGAINLTQFVTSDRGIDLGKLKYVTEMAVRMLDNVVDLFDFPVERVNRVCRRNRRVGLGIMGFADMLYAMRVEYSSPAGRETARTVMGFINDTAHAYSEWLAIEKAAFPACEEAGIVPPRRNAALTSIAPTGTIAMMFGVSGGVEPRFALCYSKDNILGGESLQYDINAECLSALQEAGLATPDILADIRRTGKMGHIKAIPQGMCNVFVTAGEIEWQDHVRMQAAFQRYTDNAISKTINMDNSATRDDIKDAYLEAWKMGLKGCTVYRDKCRQTQVLNMPDPCPECIASGVHTNMHHKEGCHSCPKCGYSRCGL